MYLVLRGSQMQESEGLDVVDVFRAYIFLRFMSRVHNAARVRVGR